MMLSRLQVAPFMADKKENGPLKGAGELTMYGLVRMEKENGYKEIWLCPTKTSHGFYEKIGFKLGNSTLGLDNNFHLLSEDFDDFLDRVESKYEMKKDSTTDLNNLTAAI